MADEEVLASDGTLEVPAPVEEAPARSGRSRRAIAQPVTAGNCVGELVQLPDVEGTTYHSYQCQVCGQIVYVGHEDLEANGLPPEHSPTLIEEK